jgi:tRNA A-37 threonylcarbamoyl transferase component Bud32
LKPDLFLSWLPFVELSGEVHCAGVLGSYALQQAGCVRGLFEAKRRDLSDGDFGELCAYNQCIDGICCGMVFDSTQFWLYKSSSGFPVSLLKSRWTHPGSEQEIRSFFSSIEEPPLLILLRALLEKHGVGLCHVNGRCYLGSGASGHVFRVGDSKCPQALKVVITTSHTHVAGEFGRLQQAADLNAPVVRPVAGSLHELRNIGLRRVSGGGFLLQDVGEPFSLTSQGRCEEAFEALSALHRVGIIHGDPRIPNLLLVDKKPAWIDLHSAVLLPSVPKTMQAAQFDAAILVGSILAKAAAVPTDVSAALDCYDYTTPNSIKALAARVWAAYRAPTAS